MAELSGYLPWGLVLIYDRETTDMPPPWISDDDIVTWSSTAVAVGGTHPDEGEMVAALWRHEGSFAGELISLGVINVYSGVLVMSDALLENAHHLAVEPGYHELAVFANSTSEPNLVNFVLDPRRG